MDKTGSKLSMNFQYLKKSYRDPLTEVHISFFTSALSIFTKYNLFLDRNDPIEHKVYPVTRDLVPKSSTRFHKPKIGQDELSLEITFNPLNSSSVR